MVVEKRSIPFGMWPIFNGEMLVLVKVFVSLNRLLFVFQVMFFYGFEGPMG